MSSVEKARKEKVRRESSRRTALPEMVSFEVPPPPVPAKDIRETTTADVV